jgi:hypothetical protein
VESLQQAYIIQGVSKMSEIPLPKLSSRPKFSGLLSPTEVGSVPSTMRLQTPFEGEIALLREAAKLGTSVHNNYSVWQDKEFMRNLSEYAKESNTPIENLLAVMAKETWNTFDPSKKSDISTATGLVQFLEKTAKALGTSTDDLRKMSRVEQLPFAIKIFNRGRGSKETPRNLVDTYLSVFAPAHINKSEDYKMYKKGGTRYKANPSLDPDNEGYISKRTIRKALAPFLNKVRDKRENN